MTYKGIRTALWTICFISMLSISNAQNNSLGFYGTVNDFVGDLNGNNFKLFKYKYFQPGLSIGFEQNLSQFFNSVETLSYDWIQYQTDNKLAGLDAQFVSLDFRFKYKLNNNYIFKINDPIRPFIDLGGGGNYFKSRKFIQDKGGATISEETKFHLVAGLGINFRINERLGFEIASHVFMPMYDGWDGITAGGTDIWANDIHVQHRAGFVFGLRKFEDADGDGVSDRKDICPGTPKGVKVDKKGCPIDTDGDGIPDYQDRCPTKPGSRALDGCPDRDHDFVPDIDDACPDVPGLIKNRGCPDYSGNSNNNNNNYKSDPDSDGDGVPDSRDKCPNTPSGTEVDENGCPIVKEDNTDTDGDGVPDRIDRCPNTPGPKWNRGCPEVKADIKKRLKFATRGIYFETGKAVLKPESAPMLDEIIDIINQYPDYNLRLGGHTDNVGGDAYNMTLSQSRVDAVKNYLVEKGKISPDRLDAIGYGKTKPIATNATAVGKALNRRVELELYLK